MHQRKCLRRAHAVEQVHYDEGVAIHIGAPSRALVGAVRRPSFKKGIVAVFAHCVV